MMTELKPCPFCKQNLKIENNIFAVHPKNNCVLALNQLGFHIRNSVWVEAWNRRVSENDGQTDE